LGKTCLFPDVNVLALTDEANHESPGWHALTETEEIFWL
jgi:hypothetical protein